MQINEQNIDIPEIILPETPKKRGRPKKSPTVTKTSATGSIFSVGTVGADPLDPLQKLVTEKEKLKSELLRLSDYNPDVVLKPVNDKLASVVESMSIEELRARVRLGHRNQSSKMDGTVAAQAINLANQLSGRLLGCLEELTESSSKDKLLNECVKDYLCMNILDYIPNNLKIGGLYSSHVASAYYAAQQKKKEAIKIQTDSPEREQIKQALNSPEIKSKLEELKMKFGSMSVRTEP